MTKARDLANIISGGFDATDIPNLDTAKITSGTFVDARLPATALNSNVDLTNLSASNLTSGTIPTARITALPTGLGGKILQVVHTKLETGVSANNSTVASGLIASITPSSTSSKILVMTTVGGIRNTSGVWFEFYVYRQINGGGYSNFDTLEGGLLYNSSTITTNMARNIMDTTHNTTNQIDYQIYFKPTNGVGTINIDGVESSTITLMEVSG